MMTTWVPGYKTSRWKPYILNVAAIYIYIYEIYILINNTVAAGDHLKHRRRLFGKKQTERLKTFWRPFPTDSLTTWAEPSLL